MTLPVQTPKVVYVAGFGRSGSTLLDMLLSSHLGALGVGEVARIFDGIGWRWQCSCGEPVETCAVWSEALSQALPATTSAVADAARVSRQVESIPGSWRWLRRGNRLQREYARLWRSVMTTVAAKTPGATIVDSSKTNWKTAGRFAALHHLAGLDVYVVHLVRDPRGVMRSVLRGSNQKLESKQDARLAGGALRALAGWMLANITVHVVARLSRARIVRLRYEDLVRDPDGEVRRVCAALGLTAATAHAAGGELDAGHGIGGNRMRRSGPVEIREDADWRASLPRHARMLAWLSWPVAHRYGYSLAQR